MPRMYSYLVDDGYIKKKAKCTKTCIMKYEIKYEDYKKCLEKNKTMLKSQQRLRSESRNVFTEKINKIALSASGHFTKRISRI